jgi:hypothetical protein
VSVGQRHTISILAHLQGDKRSAQTTVGKRDGLRRREVVGYFILVFVLPVMYIVCSQTYPWRRELDLESAYQGCSCQFDAGSSPVSCKYLRECQHVCMQVLLQPETENCN